MVCQNFVALHRKLAENPFATIDVFEAVAVVAGQEPAGLQEFLTTECPITGRQNIAALLCSNHSRELMRALANQSVDLGTLLNPKILAICSATVTSATAESFAIAENVIDGLNVAVENGLRIPADYSRDPFAAYLSPKAFAASSGRPSAPIMA